MRLPPLPGAIPLESPNILASLPHACVHTLALVRPSAYFSLRRLAGSEFSRDSGAGNCAATSKLTSVTQFVRALSVVCVWIILCHPAPGPQPNTSAAGQDQRAPPGSPRELSPAFLGFFLTALISDDSFVVCVPSPLFLYFVLFIVTS